MKKFIIGIGVVIIIVMIISVVLLISVHIGGGKGNGNGESSQVINELTEENKSEELKNTKVIIKVEEDKIYVDGEECADIEELKDRIKKINSQKNDIKYVFEHEYAIKATYDEVKHTLDDLEKVLEINIKDEG